MNITLTVPVEWLQASHPMFENLKTSESLQRRMVTELLYQCQEQFGVRALTAPPSSPPGAATMRVALFVPERLARYISSVSRASGLMPGATAKGLLHHYWKNQPKAAAPAYASAARSPMALLLRDMRGVQERSEQVAAFNAMEDALQGGKIGLVEASTGVGKTLAAIFAAARWVERESMTLAIAVPTLALMHQVIAEYRSVLATRPVPKLRVFLGKREFVSEHACAAMLDSISERWPAVKNWIERRGPPSKQDGIDSHWLAGELRQLEPDFPVEEVLLGDISDPSDEGYKAYRRQFLGDEQEPALLLCTHAMLAQDMRLRLRAANRDEEFAAVNEGVFELISSLRTLEGEDREIGKEQLMEARRQLGEVLSTSESIRGVLPKYQALIVDEAHALEANFSAALSEYLALRKVVRLLSEYRREGGRVSAASVDEVADIVSSIHQGVSVRAEFISMASTELGATRDALTRLLAVLGPLAKATPRNPSQQRAILHGELRRATNLIRLVLTQANSRSYIRLSPQRSYPQLYVGRDNVESVLQMMWSSVRAGVALSATLYLYRSTGPHSAYISGLLGIPDARKADYAPIEAQWLSDCIELIDIPTGARAAKLRPPSRRDRLDEKTHLQEQERWLDEVAKELRRIHRSSSGGMLVLNTSYETVNALADRLKKGLSEALVCAGEGIGIQKQARQFLQLEAAGSKPVWLAVGGAWTGLDVGGHARPRLLGSDAVPAELDNVLCDLVIPRLPFGTNNSITHLRRVLTKPSVPWDLLDAGFRFRQALGRLVRRQGLPRNRRIWVLDGRLADADAATRLAVFLAPVNRIRERVAAFHNK